MSVANFQFEKNQALGRNRKEVSGTYTVKTGRTADGFVRDNPVDVSITAAFTLTVPAGDAMGQKLLIACSARDTYDCTISVSHHETSDPETYTMDAVDEYLFLVWTGTEWAEISKSCTTA